MNGKAAAMSRFPANLRRWLPLLSLVLGVATIKTVLLLFTDLGSNLLVADEYTNLDYANSILTDLSYQSRDGSAYRPPVYSLVLVLVKLLVGNKIIYYKLFNIGLSLITITVVYSCLPARWNLIGAFALAVYPTYFFLFELVLAENLAILWVAIIVHVLRNTLSRFHLRSVGVLGVVSGLLILTRPESLAYLLVLHAWLCIKNWRHIYVLLIMIAITQIWLVRNQIIFNRYPLLSTNGANTFYLATFPESTGTGIYTTDDLKQFPTFARDLEAMRNMGELQQYEYYLQQGRKYLVENPSRFIMLLPIRIRTLLAPEFAVPGRLIRAGRYHLTRFQFGVYLISTTIWEFLLLMTIMVQVFRRRFNMTYLMFLVGLLGVVCMVIAEARYKIQIMPALIVGALLSFAEPRKKLPNVD